MGDVEIVVEQQNTTPEGIEKEQDEYNTEWEKLERESHTQTDIIDNDNNKDLPPERKPGASEVNNNVEDEVKSEKYGTIKSMEKALDDTKAYAHRLESERAELKRKLEEAEKGRATKEEVEQAEKDVQKAEGDLDAIKAKVYEDYPELQALIDPILERNKALESKIISLESQKTQKSEQDEKAKLLDNFNKNIKPKVLEVHNDFDSIVQSEDYWKWAERQRPSLRTAAMDSSDVNDIVWAIGEFKKDQAKQEIPGIKSKEKNDRETRLKNSRTLRGGATSFPVSQEKNNDPNDYSRGWDEAGDTLRKQGIGTG